MISEITNQIFNKCLVELQNKNVKNKINNILIEPILICCIQKMQPYFTCLFIILIIIITLQISIIFILYCQKK